MFLLLENITCGGVSSVKGNRHVKSDGKKKIIYMDATILFGQSMSQMLPYDESGMWYGHPDLYTDKLEEFLGKTSDEKDFTNFIEVDLKYLDKIKEKTKHFPFCLEVKKINPDKYNDYMKKNKT